MADNGYLREKWIGSHKNFIYHLTEEEVLDSLQLIVAEVCMTYEDHIPTDEKYKEVVRNLIKRFIDLRDDKISADGENRLEKLQELASDFLEFEFKVKLETE